MQNTTKVDGDDGVRQREWPLELISPHIHINSRTALIISTGAQTTKFQIDTKTTWELLGIQITTLGLEYHLLCDYDRMQLIESPENSNPNTKDIKL